MSTRFFAFLVSLSFSLFLVGCPGPDVAQPSLVKGALIQQDGFLAEVACGQNSCLVVTRVAGGEASIVSYELDGKIRAIQPLIPIGSFNLHKVGASVNGGFILALPDFEGLGTQIIFTDDDGAKDPAKPSFLLGTEVVVEGFLQRHGQDHIATITSETDVSPFFGIAPITPDGLGESRDFVGFSGNTFASLGGLAQTESGHMMFALNMTEVDADGLIIFQGIFSLVVDPDDLGSFFVASANDALARAITTDGENFTFVWRSNDFSFSVQQTVTTTGGDLAVDFLPGSKALASGVVPGTYLGLNFADTKDITLQVLSSNYIEQENFEVGEGIDFIFEAEVDSHANGAIVHWIEFAQDAVHTKLGFFTKQ